MGCVRPRSITGYPESMLLVYTKTGCPGCRQVLAFLKERKVPFEERECRGDQKNFEELIAKSGQEKTPTLDLDGIILADTDAAAVELWLKERNMLQ